MPIESIINHPTAQEALAWGADHVDRTEKAGISLDTLQGLVAASRENRDLSTDEAKALFSLVNLADQAFGLSDPLSLSDLHGEFKQRFGITPSKDRRFTLNITAWVRESLGLTTTHEDPSSGRRLTTLSRNARLHDMLRVLRPQVEAVLAPFLSISPDAPGNFFKDVSPLLKSFTETGMLSDSDRKKLIGLLKAVDEGLNPRSPAIHKTLLILQGFEETDFQTAPSPLATNRALPASVFPSLSMKPGEKKEIVFRIPDSYQGLAGIMPAGMVNGVMEAVARSITVNGQPLLETDRMVRRHYHYYNHHRTGSEVRIVANMDNEGLHLKIFGPRHGSERPTTLSHGSYLFTSNRFHTAQIDPTSLRADHDFPSVLKDGVAAGTLNGQGLKARFAYDEHQDLFWTALNTAPGQDHISSLMVAADELVDWMGMGWFKAFCFSFGSEYVPVRSPRPGERIFIVGSPKEMRPIPNTSFLGAKVHFVSASGDVIGILRTSLMSHTSLPSEIHQDPLLLAAFEGLHADLKSMETSEDVDDQKAVKFLRRIMGDSYEAALTHLLPKPAPQPVIAFEDLQPKPKKFPLPPVKPKPPTLYEKALQSLKTATSHAVKTLENPEAVSLSLREGELAYLISLGNRIPGSAAERGLVLLSDHEQTLSAILSEWRPSSALSRLRGKWNLRSQNLRPSTTGTVLPAMPSTASLLEPLHDQIDEAVRSLSSEVPQTRVREDVEGEALRLGGPLEGATRAPKNKPNGKKSLEKAHVLGNLEGCLALFARQPRRFLEDAITLLDKARDHMADSVGLLFARFRVYEAIVETRKLKINKTTPEEALPLLNNIEKLLKELLAGKNVTEKKFTRLLDLSDDIESQRELQGTDSLILALTQVNLHEVTLMDENLKSEPSVRSAPPNNTVVEESAGPKPEGVIVPDGADSEGPSHIKTTNQLGNTGPGNFSWKRSSVFSTLPSWGMTAAVPKQVSYQHNPKTVARSLRQAGYFHLAQRLSDGTLNIAEKRKILKVWNNRDKGTLRRLEATTAQRFIPAGRSVFGLMGSSSTRSAFSSVRIAR